MRRPAAAAAYLPPLLGASRSEDRWRTPVARLCRCGRGEPGTFSDLRTRTASSRSGSASSVGNWPTRPPAGPSRVPAARQLTAVESRRAAIARVEGGFCLLLEVQALRERFDEFAREEVTGPEP